MACRASSAAIGSSGWARTASSLPGMSVMVKAGSPGGGLQVVVVLCREKAAVQVEFALDRCQRLTGDCSGGFSQRQIPAGDHQVMHPFDQLGGPGELSV